MQDSLHLAPHPPQPKGLPSLKVKLPFRVTLMLPLRFPFYLPPELITPSSQSLEDDGNFFGGMGWGWYKLCSGWFLWTPKYFFNPFGVAIEV